MKLIQIQDKINKDAKAEKNRILLEAMDVKGKIVFIYLTGKMLSNYKGNIEWEVCRRKGATDVIFVPDHMKIEAFTDKDLASIGLQRIPKPTTPDAA